MEPITISFFDIYKIGPGPSSSHTIGPMRAGFHFFESMKKLDDALLKKATEIDVTLYGSLSATGHGHGTDRAVAAGLFGWKPDTCDADEVLKIFSRPEDVYQIQAKAYAFPFTCKNVIFGDIYHSFPYSNTMIIRLKAKDDVLMEKEYYSLGGGFIECKGEPKKATWCPEWRLWLPWRRGT